MRTFLSLRQSHKSSSLPFQFASPIAPNNAVRWRFEFICSARFRMLVGFIIFACRLWFGSLIRRYQSRRVINMYAAKPVAEYILEHEARLSFGGITGFIKISGLYTNFNIGRNVASENTAIPSRPRWCRELSKIPLSVRLSQHMKSAQCFYS